MAADPSYAETQIYRASIYQKYAVGMASLPGAFLISLFTHGHEINRWLFLKSFAAMCLVILSRALFRKSLDIYKNRYTMKGKEYRK